MMMTGSCFGSAGLVGSAFSGAGVSTFSALASSDFSGSEDLRPKISSVDAGLISLAGMTSPTPIGSGFGSISFGAFGGKVGLLPRRAFLLWHAQVAHGRFRHGQPIGPQAAAGFLGFFRAPDLLLQFAFLFFQFVPPFFHGGP